MCLWHHYRKALLGLSILLGLFICAYGQEDSLAEINLGEVIIYSGKFAERQRFVAQKTELITQKEIAHLNSQTTADLLINSGHVFVQKSQQGGGSPVIRGMEASRVLLIVDGIRMNNAIYRSGHLQNIITVDQNALERIEIMHGPASTLYGSDALGGAILLRTKMPELATGQAMALSGSAFFRYSSANHEKTAHYSLNMGSRKLAWLLSYSYSDFGNLKMGSKDPKNYPGFGTRPQYITTIEGRDSIMANPNDRVQRFSGYRQWDATQKLMWKQSDKITHLLNLQYSGSSNIPRYDRLQDRRNGRLRFAEWYYGPQKRALAAYELNVKPAGFFNEFKTIISYQKLEESRHTREYRRYDRFDHRIEEVHVGNITTDARKRWKQHELTTGMDAQFNKVLSTAYRENLLTRQQTPLDSRYPNGQNRMNYAAAYAQHLLKWKGGKWVLNDGLRLQWVHLRATIADNSFFHFPFTEIKQRNLAVTGNLGVVFSPSHQWQLKASLANGFRAPNLDDAAKIFESDTAARRLIVPNQNIKPEYTYNADLTVIKSFGKAGQAEVTGFYTRLRNAIILAPFPLHGQDSLNYNGTISRTYANQNSNRAFLYGVETNITVNLTRQIQWQGTFHYTYGRQERNKKEKFPLDHIPPIFGKTGVTYSTAKMRWNIYVLFNGRKHINDYYIDGEDNAQYATPTGMPAWYTLNSKGTVEISRLLSLDAGIENILDKNYRYFSSGFSAPGRNFIIALRSKF